MKIDSRAQLVELMRHFQLPLIAVECGTAEGIFSTELISMGIEKLYLVDLWENVPFIPGCASFEQGWHDKNYEDVKEKFKDNPNVILLKGFSYKMADQIENESIGLGYVDADHTYYGAKADANSFWAKLVPGGIMAFHDYANYEYGVNRAVQEFAGEKGVEIHELKEDGDIANIGCWIQKPK